MIRTVEIPANSRLGCAPGGTCCDACRMGDATTAAQVSADNSSTLPYLMAAGLFILVMDLLRKGKR